MNELITHAVAVTDGKVTTTSLKIAEVFGKRHDNVLRDIEALEIPEEWRLLNFEESSFSQKMPNGGMKSVPMYTITRDGFTLLAMGFTGKKAMQFKIAYIETFNAMEKELRESKNLPSSDVLLATLYAEMERRINAENEVKKYRANMNRIAAASSLTFGEPSDLTGLPKDIVVATHCKSSCRRHRPQQERYIQLMLPLKEVIAECKKYFLR